MRQLLAKIALVSSALILLPIASQPISRPAQAGMFDEMVRHGLGGGPFGGGGRRHRHGGDSDSSGDDSNSGNRKAKSFTEAVRDSANFWAKQEEDAEKERANKLERQRNVDKAIEKFIETLRTYHSDLKQRGVSGSFNINQVTAGELRASLDDAYRQGKLYEFERHVGELWTRDRLMVLTLRYAEEALKPYFVGVGAKGPTVDEIKSLLGKSAREVHASALEVGEMVGVSLSFDRFIRTIYENSDRADEGLWAAGSDTKYERLGTALIDSIPREQFVSKETLEADPLGLERQFLYRFRARRTLYDCLTSKYPDFVSTKGVLVSSSASGKGFVPQPAKGGGAGALPVSAENPVWIAASSFVDQFCRTPATKTVASLVSSGKLQPESNRTDTSNISHQSSGDDGR